MNFIIDLIEATIGVFRVILAVPIFGPLAVFGPMIPIIVKAIRHK